MCNVLELVAGYPDELGGNSMAFVHARNKYYKQHGIKVTVLNFATKHNYVIDGINVISFKTYISSKENYDILISHAPNIRSHFLFLMLFSGRFKKMIFFFHGHEVVKINRVYPKPYDFINNSIFKRKLQDFYDTFKLFIWRIYFPKVAGKSNFIFVSNSLFNQFCQFTGIDKFKIQNYSCVINNSVGEIFELEKYNSDIEKKYDFITIRSNLDSSTYCIDLLVKVALKYPQKKFILIGKGNYFNFNKLPNNITWINSVLSHKEMIKYINDSKVALQLTRNDTQGVMSCELSTFGIPLLTSDIEVCHEMFDGFSNVAFVSNENIDSVDLISLSNGLIPNLENTKFSYNNTVRLEEKMIMNL